MYRIEILGEAAKVLKVIDVLLYPTMPKGAA